MRIQGEELAYKTKKPVGVFVLTWRRVRDGIYSEEDKKIYLEVDKWFKENLPEPPFYGDNNDKLFLTFSKKSSSDPTALSYSNDAYPVTVKFSDGYVRISQYRVDKNQTWYFRYLASDNRFLSDASSKQSKTLRLYRIVDDNEYVNSKVENMLFIS